MSRRPWVLFPEEKNEGLPATEGVTRDLSEGIGSTKVWTCKAIWARARFN